MPAPFNDQLVSDLKLVQPEPVQKFLRYVLSFSAMAYAVDQTLKDHPDQGDINQLMLDAMNVQATLFSDALGLTDSQIEWVGEWIAEHVVL